MQSLKVDIINGAYSRMRISGLTSIPSPEDMEVALRRLEQMAAEWQSKRSICAGYKFEEDPDLNSPSGISTEDEEAFETNLAWRLYADFGKEPHPMLIMEKKASFASLISSYAPRRQNSYPSRMPVGSGSQRWKNRIDRYFISPDPAPLNCSTNRMRTDEIEDFVESFSSYLNSGEDILTAEVTTENSALTIISNSFESPDVFYRVKANENTTTSLQPGFPVIEIKITTTNGRINKNIIPFEIYQDNRVEPWPRLR